MLRFFAKKKMRKEKLKHKKQYCVIRLLAIKSPYLPFDKEYDEYKLCKFI